jgi:VPDSG-CTERM motif
LNSSLLKLVFVGGISIAILSEDQSKNLSIERSGIVSGNGFDNTAMDWSFTTQSAGGTTRTTFSFSANGAAVPDGGSAVALLGLALTGIEVLRRKLKRD